MNRGRLAYALWFALLPCAAVLSGCSSSPRFEEEPVKANLRTIAKAYWMIHDFHRRPPRDLAELRATISDLHSIDMGGPPDVVLTSPRDQQPFVIIFGAQPAGEENELILAYEQQGADDSRYVLTTAGNIVQLSNKDFAKARFAANHRPAQGT